MGFVPILFIAAGSKGHVSHPERVAEQVPTRGEIRIQLDSAPAFADGFLI